MKILIFGDIYGRIGRNAFKKHFLDLKKQHNPDFIIVNPENISSGRGPILKHIKEIDALGGIDVYTSGNHIYDNFDDIKDYLEHPNSKLIRPANFYDSPHLYFPGKGYKILEKNGQRVLVINLMSQVFLKDQLYNPFLKVDEILQSFSGEKFHGIIIDFHRETTSEIYAMGMFLDGKVSFVYGTHTHIQTNDELVLPGGTGLLTDVGMSGPLYSIIGADFESLKQRFLGGLSRGKIEQALCPEYVVSGCVIDIDPETSTCTHIEKIRIRGRL